MFATQNNPFVTLARSLRDCPSENSTTGKDGIVDLLTYCPDADAVMIRFIWAVPMFCKENVDTTVMVMLGGECTSQKRL